MPAPELDGQPTPASRRGWQSFTEHPGLKAIALLLSVLLWVAVSARRPAEGYVSVRVEPELADSSAAPDVVPEVRALVAGRAADLMKLHVSPPVIRRRIAADAPDNLALDLVPGDVHVPAELSEDVHVLDVQPRRVVLRFARGRRLPDRAR